MRQTPRARSADEHLPAALVWNSRPIHVKPDTGPLVEVRLDQPLAAAVAELERHFIAHAMRLSGGRVTEAAARLGLSRKGLFLKRRRQGLTAR